MTPLVRKEIRLLIPAWCLAIVLAAVPVWILWPGEFWGVLSPPGALVFVPFAAGLLLLAITSFGQELSLGTFPVLLAQPVPRIHLWRIKTGILALAVSTVFVALLISNQIRADGIFRAAASPEWQT